MAGHFSAEDFVGYEGPGRLVVLHGTRDVFVDVGKRLNETGWMPGLKAGVAGGVGDIDRSRPVEDFAASIAARQNDLLRIGLEPFSGHLRTIDA